MPRVVQVPSETEEVNVNVYHADSSDSEETVNRNFNQTVNVPENVNSNIRFPINYSLYNVTYLDSENEQYCLRCVIDGQVKKFKKDARTWLHKSSERKRKLNEEILSDATDSDIATANKNLRLVTDAQHFATCGRTYRSGTHNADVHSDFLSDLSSLGDSDADLTYSEESSPSITSESREKYQKSVRFDDTVNTGYRIHSISSSSDESLNIVGKTTSSRNIIQDESEVFDHDCINSCNANESRNNVRPGPKPLGISRIAPAIGIETESLSEILIDYAVNLSGVRQVDDRSSSNGHPSKESKYSAVRKLKNKKKRQESVQPYNLRSTKKNSPLLNVKDTYEVVQSSNTKGSKESYHNITDVRPAVGSMNLAHSRTAVGTDQMPSCSHSQEYEPENSSITKLFVLAGRVLYKHLKSELNKHM